MEAWYEQVAEGETIICLGDDHRRGDGPGPPPAMAAEGAGHEVARARQSRRQRQRPVGHRRAGAVADGRGAASCLLRVTPGRPARRPAPGRRQRPLGPRRRARHQGRRPGVGTLHARRRGRARRTTPAENLAGQPIPTGARMRPSTDQDQGQQPTTRTPHVTRGRARRMGGALEVALSTARLAGHGDGWAAAGNPAEAVLYERSPRALRRASIAASSNVLMPCSLLL